MRVRELSFFNLLIFNSKVYFFCFIPIKIRLNIISMVSSQKGSICLHFCNTVYEKYVTVYLLFFSFHSSLWPFKLFLSDCFHNLSDNLSKHSQGRKKGENVGWWWERERKTIVGNGTSMYAYKSSYLNGKGWARLFMSPVLYTVGL